MVKDRAVLKVAPGLAKTPKGQGLFLILLVIMASFGAASLSYFAYTNYIHPPLQLFGICQAPATLGSAGGVYAGIGGHTACFTISEKTELVNGQQQVVPVQVPAGTFEYLNGSAAAP